MKSLATVFVLMAIVLAACATVMPLTPAASPATSAPTAALHTATSTISSCMPCGRAAATMTARVPATQTAQVAQAEQTRVAPTVRAAVTGTAAAFAASTQAAQQACIDSGPLCYLDGHFLLARPIGLDGNQTIERSYPYGSTQERAREPHHGVEFANPFGTPVLSAAEGKVVFAGQDDKVVVGLYPGFYGNVVVVEHRFSGTHQKVYTLYGHLSKIFVQPGQQISTGERLGLVGASGTAIGSHLHFEVRLADNSYTATRNPVLWLMPLAGTGVLAGHIEDGNGKLQPGNVNVQRVVDGTLVPVSVAALQPYATKEPKPIRPDTDWGEDFAVGDLPAGDYRLTLVYHDSIYEQMVKIEPGRLTLVRFVVR